MSAGATERQSRHFSVSSRKLIAEGSDMFVKEFSFGPNEGIPWHSHSQVFDIFYCLEGQLQIESAEIANGQARPCVMLDAGESTRIEAGTPHHPSNPGTGPCRFLLIQGIGQYDWLPFKGGHSQS
ncbi:MAG: hypothetical protein JWN73_3272 [Betaproteobacteria bacterium]|nr:hypothetical protein [Betaproteobacteria bacterium]